MHYPLVRSGVDRAILQGMTSTQSRTTVSLLGIFLLACTLACSDDAGSCLIGDSAEPWSCIEYSSQVPTKDAKGSCTGNGSVWQEQPCSLDSAFGQCVDAIGSTVVYYDAFLTELQSTEESFEMSCTEADGTYSSLGDGE